MNGYLLDTHVWLWVQQSETKRLDQDLLLDLENHQRQRLLFVSAISILEIARLVALQQYALASTIDDFVAEATADDGFQLLDLTPRILIELSPPACPARFTVTPPTASWSPPPASMDSLL